MSVQALRAEQRATLRRAAESWEKARTLREDVGYEEGMRRKRTYQAYARADFILYLLDEVDRLSALATSAPAVQSLPYAEKSTPKGGSMEKKTPEKATKRTKTTKRKPAPKTARAKTGTRKRATKKAATT